MSRGRLACQDLQRLDAIDDGQVDVHQDHVRQRRASDFHATLAVERRELQVDVPPCACGSIMASQSASTSASDIASWDSESLPDSISAIQLYIGFLQGRSRNLRSVMSRAAANTPCSVRSRS